MHATRIRRSIVTTALLALALAFLPALPAGATEGGGGAYPNGAEDFMSGAVPPPGTYFINYFGFYSAKRFRGDDGRNRFPFKADIFSNTFRLIHITDKKVLGATWGMHIFVPLVKMNVHTSPGGSDSREGLGDVIVDPLILSWHGPNWHLVTALDIYCPTGEYDRDRVANIGRNYWTFEPIVAGTYVTDGGYEVSAKFMYDINTRNDESGYRSGQEFHVDYTLAKKLGNLSAGLGGYYYQQTTDDDARAATMDKGMTVSVGPQLKYDAGRLSFTLKYLFEMESHNRPQGNNLWAKLSYAF